MIESEPSMKFIVSANYNHKSPYKLPVGRDSRKEPQAWRCNDHHVRFCHEFDLVLKKENQMTENYRNWKITFSSQRPLEKVYQAEKNGVILNAAGRVRIERAVDARIREYPGE
jgi:hypothetical protein